MEKYLKNLTPLENQGLCNKLYQTTVNNKKYIVRKFELTGVDREFEYKIQHKAYRAGIAAKPIDINDKYMVAKFLYGVHKQKLNREDLRLLAKILNKLHKIKIQKYSKNLVICHHDLNPKNILFYNKKIKFIDWEFARLNDRYFDLASICEEFKLNRSKQIYFLKNYSKNLDIKKLKKYKKIYKKMWKDWFNQRNLHTH